MLDANTDTNANLALPEALTTVTEIVAGSLNELVTASIVGAAFAVVQDLGFRIMKLEPAGVWMGTTTDDYRIYNEDEHRPDHAVELFRITKEYGV